MWIFLRSFRSDSCPEEGTSYRKLGTEPLLSTAFVLLYSISSDHGAMQPSHISPMEALLCDVDKDDATVT